MENNHFDELLYSLPDYITGELDDENLKSQIEAKLLIDSSFREEYDSLKSTMNFLLEAELESPSEVYFANLQANILSKVHKQETPERQSVLAKLVGYWKVLIPALTVCVVVVVYSNMNTPPLPLKEVKVPSSFTEKPVIKNQDTNTENNIAFGDQNPISNDDNSSANEFVNTFKYKKSESFSSNNTVSPEEITASSEETVGSIIFGKDDEIQTQDEYDNLSTDDQLDVLQNLKDKKL